MGMYNNNKSLTFDFLNLRIIEEVLNIRPYQKIIKIRFVGLI